MNEFFENTLTSSMIINLDRISNISRNLSESIEKLNSTIESTVNLSNFINRTLEPLVESLRKFTEYISSIMKEINVGQLNAMLCWKVQVSFQPAFDDHLYIDRQANAPPLLDKIELLIILFWIVYLEKIFLWSGRVIVKHYLEKLIYIIFGIS